MSLETVQETLQETLQKEVEDTYHGFVLSPLINTLVAIIILIGLYDWWHRYMAHDNRAGMRDNIERTHLAAGITGADINPVHGR